MREGYFYLVLPRTSSDGHRLGTTAIDIGLKIVSEEHCSNMTDYQAAVLATEVFVKVLMLVIMGNCTENTELLP